MFGIYQPLLGWRSKRIEERFDKGFAKDKAALLHKLKSEFTGLVDLTYASNRVDVGLKPGVLAGSTTRGFDSVLLDVIARKLPADGPPANADWAQAITASSVEAALKGEVAKTYAGAFSDVLKSAPSGTRARAASRSASPAGASSVSAA